MRTICGDFDAQLRKFSEEYHHIHLLIEYPPKVAISAPVNSLKGVPRAGSDRSSPGA